MSMFFVCKMLNVRIAQFSKSTQFQCQKQLFFKQLSLA